MPKKQAVPIEADQATQLELKKLIARHSTPQQIALRARIIQRAAQNQTNAEIARGENVHVDIVRKWRWRWHGLQAVSLEELSVEERLSDAPRPGRQAIFTAEQVCKITALACEKPCEQSQRPISQWSSREIAAEVKRRGIVETISARHAARLLNRGI
jgi:putative transposase